MLVVAVYFINDPFKVLYHYDSYFTSAQNYPIILDKDYVSSRTFLQNNSKYHYDSYIFGNSRSGNFLINDWKQHINSDKCFHFDGSCESLYNIEKNIAFIKKNGGYIKNALFVLDPNILYGVTENKGHLFILDPLASGGSKLEFQLVFLKDYLEPAFIKQYFSYLIRHKLNPKYEVPVGGMLNYARDTRLYDPVTNEIYYQGLEEAIARNRDSFFDSRSNYFTKRDTVQQYSEVIIGGKQIALLNSIKSMLNEDHAQYKIILSPLYSQVKLNEKDIKALCDIFGKENVFDFSGINDITNNMYNYYESYHYRPEVAKLMMDSIYRSK